MSAHLGQLQSIFSSLAYFIKVDAGQDVLTMEAVIHRAVTLWKTLSHTTPPESHMSIFLVPLSIYIQSATVILRKRRLAMEKDKVIDDMILYYFADENLPEKYLRQTESPRKRKRTS